MTSKHVIKTVLISFLTVCAASAQAQLTPASILAMTGQNQMMSQNQLRAASAMVNKNLVHGEVLNVRKLLASLNQGDLVVSLDIEAQALQPGAYLEIIVDNAVVGQLALRKRIETVSYALNLKNGVNYNRLMVRSIGSAYVRVLTGQVEIPNSGQPLPPLPPPPPPFQPPHQNPNPQPPPPPPPAGPQNPPLYPPPQGGVSLAGYCADYDHSQFAAAKSLAYSGSGLDLTDDQAVQWALSYNQSHACGTINEYQARFAILKTFAYSGSGLDMTAANAVQFALSKAETTSVGDAQRMSSKAVAIKNFAYSGSGLDLTAEAAQQIAYAWIDRGYCEDENGISAIASQYAKEYQFAYSGTGLDYSAAQAKEYALSRIRGMSRCGDLLK